MIDFSGDNRGRLRRNDNNAENGNDRRSRESSAVIEIQENREKLMENARRQ